MNVTKDGFKDRQLHMEDYLQMVPAEQKEYAEVSVYQRITGSMELSLNNGLFFQSGNGLMPRFVLRHSFF